MNNVMALIPARAGSVRLPGKNTAMIGGRPMIEWSIIAARHSKIFREVVVSTNDEAVWRIARKFPDVMVIEQPVFEQDDQASLNVVKHALDLRYHDYVMLLQPTSPLRTARHIKEAWTLFQGSFPMDSTVSIAASGAVNGAIYIFTAYRVRNKGLPIYDEETPVYVMEDAASVDVDTLADLDRARGIMDATNK